MCLPVREHVRRSRISSRPKPSPARTSFRHWEVGPIHGFSLFVVSRVLVFLPKRPTSFCSCPHIIAAFAKVAHHTLFCRRTSRPKMTTQVLRRSLPMMMTRHRCSSLRLARIPFSSKVMNMFSLAAQSSVGFFGVLHVVRVMLQDKRGRPLPTDNEDTPTIYQRHIWRNRVRGVLSEEQEQAFNDAVEAFFATASSLVRHRDIVAIPGGLRGWSVIATLSRFLWVFAVGPSS